MRKLFLMLILTAWFSCIETTNDVKINSEKSAFSNKELKILEPHFKNDTTVKKIKAIKIQTH